ncbi:MAG: bifunctional DNA primase/polymerase [Bacteroidota bacterium]
MLTAELWSQIQYLHDAGFNLIPVRDKDEPGDGKKAKSPFRNWTEYKTKKIEFKELLTWLDYHKTEAVAVVCGTISGGLENIDIDTKHEPGIDAFIFSDLKALYPELFEKLRIHKTPSGGYHLLYRVHDHQPGSSCNLAERSATETELLEKPKRPTYCFIELKGEGGLSQMPPSAGYSVYQDRPVPDISWHDRCSIVNLMKSYSRVVKHEVEYKPTKSESDYYDENPFYHFNTSDKAACILTDNGWKNSRQMNSQFIYFTHPESKHTGVHASFNKKTHVYRIFTSNSQFDPEKKYNPATVLSILLHNGDKKQTFRYLVNNGYGKIKSYREEKIAKRAATNNKPLPANISNVGIALHAAISAKMEQLHPYGIFWIDEPDKEIQVDRMALYSVSEGLGFMLFGDSLVKIVDGIIYDQESRDYFDCVKSYIKEEDTDLYKRIINSYESFIERHGKFTITRLSILNKDQILNDTKTHCYKPYSNCVIEITATSINEIPYDQIDKFVWHKLIQQRPYEAVPGGRYMDFLQKAIGINDYLYSCIGYLSHRYKEENSSFILALTEQCENPEDGGGSGKNVFCKLFEHTTTFMSTSGEQVSYDSKFLQSWKNEKIFCISDPPKSFKWGFLKDLTTNDGMIKKLYQDEATVLCEDMPKFIVPTNFSYDGNEPGIKRRIRQLEFTGFFTVSGGVDVHYGCHFPKGWNSDDWAGYDFVITTAVQKWISSMKIPKMPLSAGGWSKQFEQNYGYTISGFMKEYWATFARLKFITLDQLRSWKDLYCKENDVIDKYKPTSHKLNKAMAEWALNNGFSHNKDARDRTQPGEPRGHSFQPIEAPF